MTNKGNALLHSAQCFIEDIQQVNFVYAWRIKDSFEGWIIAHTKENIFFYCMESLKIYGYKHFNLIDFTFFYIITEYVM